MLDAILYELNMEPFARELQKRHFVGDALDKILDSKKFTTADLKSLLVLIGGPKVDRQVTRKTLIELISKQLGSEKTTPPDIDVWKKRFEAAKSLEELDEIIKKFRNDKSIRMIDLWKFFDRSSRQAGDTRSGLITKIRDRYAKNFSVLYTVDCVTVTPDRRVLLIKRLYEPFKGYWALPGGKIEEKEDRYRAAMRELREETGIVARRLIYVRSYGTPSTEPHGPSVSHVYLARVPSTSQARAGDDAGDVMWTRKWHTMNLAFIHKTMIRDTLDYLDKLER